jgi:hypothetical protein
VQINIARLKALADSAAAHNVVLLTVNFPQNPGYRAIEMAGKDGPGRSTFRELSALLREMEHQNPYFHFYDAHNDGEHDYIDDEARDTNHLNIRGGQKLAARVDSLLQIILE